MDGKRKIILNKIVFCGLIALAAAVPVFGRNIKYLWLALGFVCILRGKVSLKNPMFLPVFLFAFITVVSALTGVNPGGSFRYIIREDINIMLFFILASCAFSDERFDVPFRVFLVSAFAVSLFAIFQYGFQHNLSAQKIFGKIGAGSIAVNQGRAYAFRAHPVMFAANLCLYIPIMAALAVFRKRLPYIIGLFTMLLALAISYSRGPILALTAVFVLSGVLFFKKIKLLIGIIAVSIAVLLMVISVSRGMPVRERLNLNSAGRIELWKISKKMIYDFPLFGVGAGNAINVYEKSYRVNKFHFYHLHNTFIQITVERGVFALLIYLWAFYVFFRNLFLRAGVAGLSDNRRVILIGMMFGFTAYFLTGFTDYIFYRSEMYFPFYFLAGLAMSRAFQTELPEES